MLILTRKIGESIKIDEITVTVHSIRSKNQVRLGIDAPPNTRILRSELEKGADDVDDRE